MTGQRTVLEKEKVKTRKTVSEEIFREQGALKTVAFSFWALSRSS